MEIQHFWQHFLRPKDRRKHARITTPSLQLKIDGRKYRTLDWSLGGLRINGFHADVKPRDRLSGTIAGVGGVGGGGPGEFVAEVMRVAENGDVSVRLLEISPAIFLAMGGLRAR